MKNKDFLRLQLFAESNMIMSKDLEPAISVDFTTRLGSNITELQNLLGIVDLEPMSSGTTIKIYKMAQVNTPEQVAEGETIGLTKIEQKLARTEELKLEKYRKETPAETIQKVGRNLAVNKTDEKLVSGIQKDIKKKFYSTIEKGLGKATGVGLQAALSAAWAAVKKYYADEDATPIFFVPSDDVAEYLGKAQVTMQTAFGMTYIENFLGLGTAVISPSMTQGKVIATAKENLRGVYIPANSGDVAESFGLTSDATGLIGMTHYVKGDNATVGTLIVSGVLFYPEFLDGVIISTIESNAEEGTDPAEKTYTEEELNALTVDKIKGLAAFRGYTITSTTKAEIIQEFLTKQAGA